MLSNFQVNLVIIGGEINYCGPPPHPMYDTPDRNVTYKDFRCDRLITANLYEIFRTKPGRKAVKKLRKYESVVFPWLVFLFLHRSCGARKQKQTVCKLTIYTGDVALYQQNIFAVQTLEKKSL